MCVSGYVKFLFVKFLEHLWFTIKTEMIQKQYDQNGESPKRAYKFKVRGKK